MEKSGARPAIKAVFVLPSLSAGGAERVLINLMNGLDRSLFDPVLINVIPKGSLKDLIAPGIQTVNLNAGGVFRALPALYRALKEQKPDIVVSTMAHMNFTALLLQPFFPKTKFIVREAIVPSFILDRHPIFAPLIHIAYKFLYRRADIIISPSKVIIDEFSNGFALADKNHVLLYNPVDTDFIATKQSAFQAAPEDRADIRFVASGRLHYQKGFDRLLQSLAGFKPSFSWHLTILGDGDQKAELQSLITANNLQDKVRLVGHTDNPWGYYNRADYLLLPSRWEGMPNVALESLACGTPVIASKEAGGIAEIASYAGADNVRIAADMDGFMEVMGKSQKKGANTSSLPYAFDKNHINAQFKDLLLNVVQL